ncbi:MAG: hypothetical protein Harvfovirus1_74 [Harvfovirus sp.]|uniref:BTB domain-containing protein n=1 Tax=Harvfovirus sp. TaxID=2487768 RepID=A0A3G5A4Q1_9VIRU|nr:MAG: hypothetical protein Harvfovirus1_74 [Harvfovirus sp.]
MGTHSSKGAQHETVTLISEAKTEIKSTKPVDDHQLRLKSLYEENNGDVVIRSKSREFKVHSTVLNMASALFKAIGGDYIKYEDETVDLFLRYVYYQAPLFEGDGMWVEITIDEIEKKRPLLELFELHKLTQGKDIIIKQLDKLIESTTNIYKLCLIANYFSFKGEIFWVHYRKSLIKLLFAINERTFWMISSGMLAVKEKGAPVNCYDNLLPGKYGRPGNYLNYLCCQHGKINPHNLRDPVANLRCRETDKVCCVSFSASSQDVPVGAETRYCCQHRSNIPEQVLLFEKEKTKGCIDGDSKIELNDKVREDLMRDMISFLNYPK